VERPNPVSPEEERKQIDQVKKEAAGTFSWDLYECLWCYYDSEYKKFYGMSSTPRAAYEAWKRQKESGDRYTDIRQK